MGPLVKGPFRPPGIGRLGRALDPIDISGEGDCSRSGTEGDPSGRRGGVGDVRTIASPVVGPNIDNTPGGERGLGSEMIGIAKFGEMIGRAR